MVLEAQVLQIHIVLLIFIELYFFEGLNII